MKWDLGFHRGLWGSGSLEPVYFLAACFLIATGALP